MALRNTIFLVLVNDVLQLPEQRLLSVGRIILLCSLRVASEMIGVLTSASDMLCQETYSSDHFFFRDWCVILAFGSEEVRK